MHSLNFSKSTRLIQLAVFCLFAPLVFGQSSQREATMKDLDAIVGNAQYVNVGEDSHFMVGVHEFVSEAFRHLVERKKIPRVCV